MMAQMTGARPKRAARPYLLLGSGRFWNTRRAFDCREDKGPLGAGTRGLGHAYSHYWIDFSVKEI